MFINNVVYIKYHHCMGGTHAPAFKAPYSMWQYMKKMGMEIVNSPKIKTVCMSQQDYFYYPGDP